MKKIGGIVVFVAFLLILLTVSRIQVADLKDEVVTLEDEITLWQEEVYEQGLILRNIPFSVFKARVDKGYNTFVEAFEMKYGGEPSLGHGEGTYQGRQFEWVCFYNSDGLVQFYFSEALIFSDIEEGKILDSLGRPWKVIYEDNYTYVATSNEGAINDLSYEEDYQNVAERFKEISVILKKIG